jgi:xyloglucan fucosyltransferase
VVTRDSEVTRSKPDETLGGLLLPPMVFEDNKCISRSQEYYSFRRRTSPYKPSPDLISKLRDYERRHRKCAPQAKNFSLSNNATEQDFGGCQFIVWIPTAGLGNRVMTLTSAFVYALLTDRVLLIDRSGDPDELFCEPFPGTSWLVPETFPNEWMKALETNSSCRFGSLIQNGNLTSSHNGYAYVNIMHDYDYNDKRFFCAQCQASLSRSFPWLFLLSNQYFVPGLHFVPEFRAELDKLFPERETVFHHIVRYLIHPSNSVWSLISSFYNTNLASAQLQVGIQIRVYFKRNITLATYSDLVNAVSMTTV